LKFFFDRNIAVRLVRMIAAYDADNEVVHEDDDDRFKPNSDDISILRALSEEDPKPVFLTGDLNMRSRYPLERKALRESGLRVVFFRKTFHNLDVHTQAQKLVKAWPDIAKATWRCAVPTAFEVNANGKIEALGPTRSL
jgi:hypothetical protein